MKKGTRIEGIVESLNFPNKGILHIDGRKMTVKNVLPGQKVAVMVTKGGEKRLEGKVLEILEKSPVETAEPCPHFGQCGGCCYQTIPYEEQLKIKAEQVAALLQPVLGEAFSLEGILPSPRPAEYRNKMEFSFGDAVKDGPMTLGLHKRGSFYDIVNVDGCRIVDEDYRKILKAVLNYFVDKQVPFYKKMLKTGILRHLVVRKGWKTGELLILLVTVPGYVVDPDFAETLLSLPLDGTIAGILHGENGSVADVVKCEKIHTLFGKNYFYEELLGLRFRITPFSFFQTNSAGAEVLYRTAREFVGAIKGQRVFDLYSGTGTIAQILAPVAEEVIGVEIVEEAVEAARQNAAENGLSNCKFLAGDVLKVLDTIEEKPDMIVLDPPRDGIHPKAMEKILKYGVERMVYISCKPTSLARDLEICLAGGYQVERAMCVDMFPGTANIETVVLLSKGEIDSKKVRVEFSLEDMDMSGFQKGATYEQIKAYVLEHTGLKVSSLYISQVKRKCGLDVGQNYNLSKKENVKVSKCPPEKEAAIMDALKYFQMKM